MRTFLFIVLTVASATAAAQTPSMVTVPAGTFRPLYPAPGEEEVRVASFRLDATPVTNAQFAAFVRRHEKWRRGKVAQLFAGDRYLEHWPSEGPDEASADYPVVNVTWWAARAYCEARDARLPTLAEWELAAAASESSTDGAREPEFTERILRWYSQPTRLRAVGADAPNFYGIHDLHGLIWEWVEDFQSEIIVVDNRSDGTIDPALFCGASAVGAVRKDDYAAFMRSAFRSSLDARHASGGLGFRCAADL